MHVLATRFDRQIYDIVRRVSQPSLAQEAKETIISAGKSVSEKLQETAEDVKQNIQSM